MRDECNEFDTKKAERHQKRLDRQKAARNGKEGGRRRADGWNSAPSNNGYAPAPYDQGPRYLDANPYGAAGNLPPPPIGYAGR